MGDRCSKRIYRVRIPRNRVLPISIHEQMGQFRNLRISFGYELNDFCESIEKIYQNRPNIREIQREPRSEA